MPARLLLVATGLTDELPDIPGLTGAWGSTVLHCPYCHGWEVRDRAIGVFGTRKRWAPSRRSCGDSGATTSSFPAHRAFADPRGDRAAHRPRGPYRVGEVTGLDHTDGVLSGVRLAPNAVVARQALVVAPRFTANADLLAGLEIKPVDQEVHGTVRGSRIPADPTGLTEVPGV